MGFVVGDRVLNKRHGQGTICVVRTDNTVGVEYDTFIHAHDCNGTCKDGYGRWERPLHLTKLDTPSDLLYNALITAFKTRRATIVKNGNTIKLLKDSKLLYMYNHIQKIEQEVVTSNKVEQNYITLFKETININEGEISND